MNQRQRNKVAKRRRTYELWEGHGPMGRKDGITLTRARMPASNRWVVKHSRRVLTFEAPSWEAACQRQHDHYGWEPYQPLLDGVAGVATNLDATYIAVCAGAGSLAVNVGKAKP